MSHSVEELYQKVCALYSTATTLHRMRYGDREFDSTVCKYLVDDVKALAADIVNGPVEVTQTEK